MLHKIKSHYVENEPCENAQTVEAVALKWRGGAYDRNVYVVESKDMDERKHLLNSQEYNLLVEELQAGDCCEVCFKSNACFEYHWRWRLWYACIIWTTQVNLRT